MRYMIGDHVKINGEFFGGLKGMIGWVQGYRVISNGEPDYLVVYWTGESRKTEWLAEQELIK